MTADLLLLLLAALAALVVTLWRAAVLAEWGRAFRPDSSAAGRSAPRQIST